MTHTVEDLMAAAVGQRPMDFETAFHQLMLGKAHAAIEDRKIEYAKNMFAKAVKEDVDIEERFGGKGSDPSLRNNPSKGASPAPAPAPKVTGKSDLMTSLTAIKKIGK